MLFGDSILSEMRLMSKRENGAWWKMNNVSFQKLSISFLSFRIQVRVINLILNFDFHKNPDF